MIKTVIWGLNGKMGKWVHEMILADKDFEFVAGVDIADGTNPLCFCDPKKISGGVDIVIDFSRADSVEAIIEFCTAKKCGVVFATTGHTDAQLQKIRALGAKVPVFKSGNFSIGITLLCKLVKQAAQMLGEDFDIEIIEKHHNQKVDSPSGTALMLAQEARAGRPDISLIRNGREGADTKRTKGEIGIHAIRGGTIVGEHDVIFAGADEIIELKHTSLSRRILASGAVKAAKFLSTVKPGFYGMDDLI